MEAKDIPMGSWVTKRGESMRRKLFNAVSVVADGETYLAQTVVEQDCLFIMTTQLSSLEAIDPTTELEWVIDWEDEYIQLQEIIKENIPT